MDVNNTGVCVEILGVGINTPGVQDTSHEDNKNEGEDDDTSEIANGDIPEGMYIIPISHHKLNGGYTT